MVNVSPTVFNNTRVQEPIVAPVDPDLLAAEIEQLRVDNLVCHQSHFEVFVAHSTQIPNLLHEIGRLREITFRSVGEGSGKCCDVDEFDAYYRQLIIWDTDEHQIVGGYRLGCGDEIFEQYGVAGFYISSLFHIQEGFFPILKQSLELGRSYVLEEYQRKPLPLFLLWKGIHVFLLEHPRYRYILGPVSISRQFSDLSRGLMVGFLERHYFNAHLAAHLSPRTPFKVLAEKQVDISELIQNMGGDIHLLDKFIEGVETKGARIPVLLKQYLRQNARFIGFNLDPNFSDCLDGFMILDMNDLPTTTIENLHRS